MLLHAWRPLDPPFIESAHEGDSSTRRVGLEPEVVIRGTGIEAESAMNTQSELGRVGTVFGEPNGLGLFGRWCDAHLCSLDSVDVSTRVEDAPWVELFFDIVHQSSARTGRPPDIAGLLQFERRGLNREPALERSKFSA